MVSWIVKRVELREIHFYTILLLDNSKSHIHYFILFGTCKVMVTTLFLFPCGLVHDGSLGISLVYFLFVFIYEDKSILVFGNSNSKDLY